MSLLDPSFETRKKKTFDEQVFVNGKFREKNVKAKIVNFYLNEERSVEGRWMEKKESNLPKHKILFRKLSNTKFHSVILIF